MSAWPADSGELRTRVPRLAELSDPAVIESSLEAMAKRPDGALVQQLPREAGRRDARWAQLFEELPEIIAAGADSPTEARLSPRAANADLVAKVAALEAENADLRAQLAALKSRG